MLAAITLAILLVAEDAPHRLVAGAFYHPGPEAKEELARMVVGDPRGRQGFNRVLAPVVRDGEPVWREYVESLPEGLHAVLDAHVLLGDEWIRDRDGDGRTAIDRLVHEIAASPVAGRVDGWYVCDEPFGKSRKGQPLVVDMKQVWDLVNEIRLAGADAKAPFLVYADYQGIMPALARDGDPVNGGRNHYTKKREDREGFYWDGEWRDSVTDRAYANGRTLRRGLGFFGEDVSMVNWGGDAESLDTWLPYLLCDVPANRLHVVGGYDWTEDSPEGNEWGVERFRAIVQVGLKARLGGFWVWPWQDIPAQGRAYKGCRDWWERVPGKDGARWAAAIEEIP